MWPRLDSCRNCGAEILKARRDLDPTRAGRPYTLEPHPVLPEGDCAHCFGRGHTAYGTCPRCHGSGLDGVPLTADMLLLDDVGRARWPWFRDGRRVGEAAYRRHRCATSAAR